MGWIALCRCQFLSPLTTVEAASLNFNFLGGCFSAESDRGDFLQCGVTPCLLAGDGGSTGMSTCCNIANIYNWIKTCVRFLPWPQVLPCKPHSGGLVLCLSLATCWHHCINPRQISEAARGVYIYTEQHFAGFCQGKNWTIVWVSGFAFLKWKNWTLSNDMDSFPKTFYFQQWVRKERFRY